MIHVMLFLAIVWTLSGSVLGWRAWNIFAAQRRKRSARMIPPPQPWPEPPFKIFCDGSPDPLSIEGLRLTLADFDNRYRNHLPDSIRASVPFYRNVILPSALSAIMPPNWRVTLYGIPVFVDHDLETGFEMYRGTECVYRCVTRKGRRDG